MLYMGYMIMSLQATPRFSSKLMYDYVVVYTHIQLCIHYRLQCIYDACVMDTLWIYYYT